MQIYSRGVRPYFELLDPQPIFSTIDVMIQACQAYVDVIYPEPRPEPVADLAPVPATHDQFPQMPMILANIDDERSDSSDDSGYGPEGESDMEIEIDASAMV